MAEQNSGMTAGETDGKMMGETGEKNREKMAEQNNENAGKMVSTRTGSIVRNGGKLTPWQPGQSGNPLGRARRADERAIIAAMDKALPPDRLSEALQDALTWAYEYKSPKLILAIAQFVVAYQIGQPVQRSVSASGKLESILSRLSAMDDSEFEAVERAIRIPVDTENE